jgi:hypothetical protein
MLLCELSTSFDLAPSFYRLHTTKDKEEARVVIVGASHAARLAEQMTGHAAVESIIIDAWTAAPTPCGQ